MRAKILRYHKLPLPFKGRVGVGMGQSQRQSTPIPLLSSPLKGEGRYGGRLALSASHMGRSTSSHELCLGNGRIFRLKGSLDDGNRDEGGVNARAKQNRHLPLKSKCLYLLAGAPGNRTWECRGEGGVLLFHPAVLPCQLTPLDFCFKTSPITCNVIAKSIGLGIKASMPASRQRCSSSLEAWAVMATMGVWPPRSRSFSRMATVASKPFSRGI